MLADLGTVQTDDPPSLLDQTASGSRAGLLQQADKAALAGKGEPTFANTLADQPTALALPAKTAKTHPRHMRARTMHDSSGRRCLVMLTVHCTLLTRCCAHQAIQRF